MTAFEESLYFFFSSLFQKIQVSNSNDASDPVSSALVSRAGIASRAGSMGLLLSRGDCVGTSGSRFRHRVRVGHAVAHRLSILVLEERG